MELTDSERMSTLWIKIREHLNDRLEKARSQLEGNLPIDETNRVRGRIVEIKELLRVGNPPHAHP